MNSFSLLHGVVSKICTVHVADFFYDFAHAEDCFWFVKTNALESKGITEHKRKLSLYSLFSRPFIYVNPLTVKNDKHLISPYSIAPKSNVKVTRIKEMITNQRSSRLLNKISLSAPKRM